MSAPERERCHQCGPGYWIGDGGCRHTPTPDAAASTEGLSEAERESMDTCPDCGHKQHYHSNVGCVYGYDRSPQKPCPCEVQWTAVVIRAVERIVAAREAAAATRARADEREAWERARDALAQDWSSATCITDGAPCSFHRQAEGYTNDLRLLAPETATEEDA